LSGPVTIIPQLVEIFEGITFLAAVILNLPQLVGKSFYTLYKTFPHILDFDD